MDLRQARKLVATTMKAVGQRLLAADALLPTLLDIADHPDRRVPARTLAWTLSGEIRRVLRDEQAKRAVGAKRRVRPAEPTAELGERAVENFRTRVIETARPVIHLAPTRTRPRDARAGGRRRGGLVPNGRCAGDRSARFDWWRFCHHYPRFARSPLALPRSSRRPQARCLQAAQRHRRSSGCATAKADAPSVFSGSPDPNSALPMLPSWRHAEAEPARSDRSVRREPGGSRQTGARPWPPSGPPYLAEALEHGAEWASGCTETPEEPITRQVSRHAAR